MYTRIIREMELVKKIIFVIFLVMLFICGISIQVFAAAPVRDNDDPSGDTWSKGTWTYKKASKSFRGDHRYRKSNSTTAEYGWELPTSHGPKVVHVYVNSGQATNTKADYWVGGKHFGYLNQNKAVGGWNSVRKSSKAVSSSAIKALQASGIGIDIAVMATGSGKTVADGIRLDK